MKQGTATGADGESGEMVWQMRAPFYDGERHVEHNFRKADQDVRKKQISDLGESSYRIFFNSHDVLLESDPGHSF